MSRASRDTGTGAVVALTGFVLPAMWGSFECQARRGRRCFSHLVAGSDLARPRELPGWAVYSFRYAFIALPPFLVLASAGVVSFPRRLQRVAALSIAVATLIPLATYYGASIPA